MPNALQNWIRAFKSRFNDVLFGSDSGYSSSATARGRSGRSYWLPGTELDWATLAGDLWLIPGVAVCLNWMQRNLPQAPPQVVTGEGEDEKQVPNHPLIQLLRQPNPEYDLNVLIAGSLLSHECRGDIYIGIERVTKHGLPDQLWYIPHWMITPKRDKQTGEKYYEYRVGAKAVSIPKEDIIHIRHGIDPLNPLCGLAPLASAARAGYVLQQGHNYAAKAMKNGGIVGGFVTPAESKDSSVTYDFEPEQFIADYTAKATGDRAGEIMAWSHPLEVHWPNVTPQQMTIDTMLDRPEADVAALIGLPPQVVGLHVGRLSKTYANMREARECAWEEKLVPTGNLIYGQIGSHLLPQMSANAEAERCCLDIRNVRPLQPDLDALYLRANSTWEKNLIDRYDWAKMVGRVPDAQDKGVYFKDVQPEQPPAQTDKPGDVEKQIVSARNGAASNGKVSA